jgi:hypothetical protein
VQRSRRPTTGHPARGLVGGRIWLSPSRQGRLGSAHGVLSVNVLEDGPFTWHLSLSTPRLAELRPEGSMTENETLSKQDSQIWTPIIQTVSDTKRRAKRGEARHEVQGGRISRPALRLNFTSCAYSLSSSSLTCKGRDG